MFRFRRGRATTSASRSTTRSIAGRSRRPDLPPLPLPVNPVATMQRTGCTDLARSLVLYEVGRLPGQFAGPGPNRDVIRSIIAGRSRTRRPHENRKEMAMGRTRLTASRRALAWSFAAALSLAAGAAAALEPVFSTTFGGAIRGYDPVAYFTAGRPVEGKRAHRLEWMGATWVVCERGEPRRVRVGPGEVRTPLRRVLRLGREPGLYRLHRPRRVADRGRSALPQLQPLGAEALGEGHPRQHRHGGRQLAAPPRRVDAPAG